MRSDNILSANNNQLSYEYNNHDDRVYKNTPTGSTYYLRDASGKELAMLNVTTNTWTHYAYGRERVAELSTGPATFYNYDHLGSVRVVYQADANCSRGNSLQYTIASANDYFAFGKTLRSFNNTNKYAYQGSEKEKELSDNDYYTHFRSLNTDIARWGQVDPLASKFPWQSPFCAMDNNPVMKTDLDGKAATPPDDYVFNEKGDYVRTDKKPGEDRLVIENSQTKAQSSYAFNDAAVDVLAVKNAISSGGMVGINRVEVLSDSKVELMIAESQVKFVKGSMATRLSFAKNEGAGLMDYGMRGFESGNLLANTFYIRGNTAYNIGDMGNYLWGRGMQALGVDYQTSVIGAHYNNIFNGRRQGTPVYDFGPGTYGSPGFWDSPGDQRAIKAGYYSSPGVYQAMQEKAAEQMEVLKSEVFNGPK